MPSRKIFLEALRALRDHEEAAEHRWVLLGMLRPDHHKAVGSAAGQGLVELAGREMRAELSVYEGTRCMGGPADGARPGCAGVHRGQSRLRPPARRAG